MLWLKKKEEGAEKQRCLLFNPSVSITWLYLKTFSFVNEPVRNLGSPDWLPCQFDLLEKMKGLSTQLPKKKKNICPIHKGVAM